MKESTTRFRTLTQMYERLFPTCADRMWAVRAALDLSQREFGEFCGGLSSSWVSMIECGYGLPRGVTLERVVLATGLSADFILGVEGKVNQRLSGQAKRYLEEAEEQMQAANR